MSNKIFRFKADERFNKWVGVPGSSGKRNITEYYISLKANSMVPEIPKDPNPRVQAPHKGIYKQIGIDLRNGNSPFWYYMNHGLQIIAKKIEYDSATRMVTMTMHPGDGIADGAHSYEIIRDAVISGKCPGNQYVKIFAYTGMTKNEAKRMSQGLNQGMKVSDESHVDNEGLFEWFKIALKEDASLDRIAFVQNDKKPFLIYQALIYMSIANPAIYPTERNDDDEIVLPPSEICKRKRSIKDYVKMMKEGNGSSPERYSDILLSFLWLVQHIQAESRLICNEAASKKGKKAGTGKTRIYETAKKGANFEFVFLKKNYTQRLHSGALYPIVGTLRMFIDDSKDKFSWKIPFDEVVKIVDKALPNIIKTTVSVRANSNKDTSRIAKDASHWRNIYNTMERMLERYQGKK